MVKQVFLKKGKEKPLLQGHPWIFSGALERMPEAIFPGEEVVICDKSGRQLARGYYNSHSQIAVRVMTIDPEQSIDRKLIETRLKESINRRGNIDRTRTNAIRLVAHESDRIPGLVVDQYGDFVCFQILTAGMEAFRQDIIELLDDILSPQGIIERSDEKVRLKEGLELRKELVKGGKAPSQVEIVENTARYMVDIWNGHKTGFYIDQRDNREIISTYARNLRVLNCFCYTGGFTVAALTAGARQVVSVDESGPALELAKVNCGLNGTDQSDDAFVRADVFQYLRELRQQEAQFDMIILDPPKFISSGRDIQKACRGYKDLNLLAWQLLKKDGYLVTFSCSGHMTLDLFQKVVFGASCDARCDGQIIRYLGQAEDHPILLSFPESYYLKGLLCRKV